MALMDRESYETTTSHQKIIAFIRDSLLMATRSSQTTARGTWTFIKLLVPLMIMVTKEGIYEKKFDWRVGRKRPKTKYRDHYLYTNCEDSLSSIQ
jgi:uncharacterized membrane protein